jgi:hypothetical protein
MLPSSGSNRVEVDRTNYRYIVSESSALPDGTVPLALTVQLHNRNGAYLRVQGLTLIPVPELPSERPRGRRLLDRANRAVRPRHVARLIRLGLAHGWKPESSGPPQILQVQNSDAFFEATGA